MLRREDVLKDEVKGIRLHSDITAHELVEQFDEIGGFMAPRLAKASKIITKMVSDPRCTIFMSFTANLVATGLRALIADIIKRGLVDVVITTGGTIDHDIARGIGGRYFRGDFNYDDSMLRELEVHRLGNVLVPMESYGPLIEKFTFKALSEAIKVKVEWSTYELLYFIGSLIDDENSILRQAHLRKVLIFSPGIVDSAFGTHMMFFREIARSRGGNFTLDLLTDLKALSDIVFESKKLGAIILGGGISKHHVIWWSQFKEGLDYAVYITTAVEWDGSLSGAQPREAISWRKLKPKAESVVVYGDVTTILPLVLAYVYKEIELRRIKRAINKTISNIIEDVERLIGK